MRTPLPLLTGLVVVASGVAIGRNLMVTKVRTASRAQIDAVLPASLKATDAPDPAGVARYARLTAILDTIPSADFSTAFLPPSTAISQEKVDAAKAHIAQAFTPLEALLREGGLRCPERKAGMLFPELTRLKGLSKMLALSAGAAAKRGDHAECAHLVSLNLCLGKALVDTKGVLIDELVAIASEAIANRSAYEVEMAGGFDAKGRAKVLALMPPLEGPMPQLGDSLRRDFQVTMLPYLTGPVDRLTKAYGLSDSGKETPAGTFDAIATARLIGRIDDAMIADTERPFRLQTKFADYIATQATEGLPSEGNLDDMPEGIEKIWIKFKYRLAMNSGSNTLGRGLVSASVFDLGSTGARRAAGRNLARTVLLLQAGKSPSEIDPYGDGSLRVDAKRKVVWSVGENGRDDGGQIGKGGESGEPDLGYPYGEGAWKPASSAPRKGNVPSAPIPGAKD